MKKLLMLGALSLVLVGNMSAMDNESRAKDKRQKNTHPSQSEQRAQELQERDDRMRLARAVGAAGNFALADAIRRDAGFRD